MKHRRPEGGADLTYVGIWIRVSTEDQAKGESPEHHEKRARAYAESKGWKVREVYHLEGVSGKSVKEHPEAKRMLADVARGHIQALIFSKLARLARNTRELLDFADYFRDQGADLVSLQEAIDTTSPAGRLFYTMIAAMAQWEREEISSRVAASVPIRAKLGKPLGGAAPLGYQWKNRQLIPDPEEVPIRRLIYELFLEHKRKKAVARLLNARGLRTRNGSKFTDTTVDRLIRDPSAKGIRRANHTRSTGDKKHWVRKPKEEWIETPIEPIISEELWVQCNALLDGTREKLKRKGRPAIHLFAGLLTCQCGAKMYTDSAYKTSKYVCRSCRNKIAVADLEAVFHDQLKGFLLDPEEIARNLARADLALAAKEDQLSTLSSEERKVRGEMERVYRAYVEDQVSVETYGRQLRPLEERLSQIETEVPRLQGEVDFMKIQLLSKDEVLSGAQDLFDRWPKLDQSEKRQIVEALVEAVRVGKTEVEFDLGYRPDASEIAGKRQRSNRDSSRRSAARRPGSGRFRSRGRPGCRRSRAARAARRACRARSARSRRGRARRDGRARSRPVAAVRRRPRDSRVSRCGAARGTDARA